MAGLRPLIASWAIIILFSICLITFMVEFIQVNNPDSVANNDSYINTTLGQLQDRTNDLKDATNNTLDALSHAKPDPVNLFLILKESLSIPLSMIFYLISGSKLVLGMLFTLLFGAGGSPFFLVFTTVTAIIILTIVFSILKGIRTGETER